VVAANSALRLRAVLDFEDDDNDKRIAGDEWLFEGPGTYIPRKEVVVEETVRATVIRPNQAIRLRARKETIDRQGVARVTGEEWLVKKTGAYLPGAYEEVVDAIHIILCYLNYHFFSNIIAFFSSNQHFFALLSSFSFIMDAVKQHIPML
jgi:hypothetical protein